MSNGHPFLPGQLVRLKAQPDSCGAIITVNESGPALTEADQQQESSENPTLRSQLNLFL